MKLQIIGAGMAGLIAANLLRRHSPEVIEAKAFLPNNHSALLRFRSDAIAHATGVPFKKVLVRKGVWDGERVVNECTIPMANRYASIVANRYVARSIWNLAPEDRWIAPDNFIEQIARNINIKFSSPFEPEAQDDFTQTKRITTAPMPINMMLFLRKSDINFPGSSICTMNCNIGRDADLYQTVYNGAIRIPSQWYRASIHGYKLTVEFIEQPDRFDIIQFLFEVFGIETAKAVEIVWQTQPYGKISSIDETVRRDFITNLSGAHGVYSLGRFATWRQGLLLDDLIQDVKIIEELMLQGQSYSHQIKKVKR